MGEELLREEDVGGGVSEGRGDGEELRREKEECTFSIVWVRTY